MGCAERSRAHGSILALAALVSSAAACNTVLGIEEKHRPEASPATSSAGAGGADAGGGCTANLMTDAESCGACGHGCQGGACKMGRCQPVQIGLGLRPNGITVDDTYVYWTEYDGGKVRRARKDGSDGSVLLSVPGHSPTEVAVASDALYVTVYGNAGDGWITRMNKDGTNAVTLSKPWNGPWGIALDDTFVYWTNRYNAELVVKAPQSGGPTVPLQTIAGAMVPVYDYMPLALALDDTFVYWTEFTTGKLWRVGKDGTGASLRWAGAAMGALGVAVDATTLYWSDGGTLHSMPKDAQGTQVKTLYESASLIIGGLALDGGWLYLASAGPGQTMQGQIARVRIDGSASAEILADDGLYTPSNIAVDATTIYWTEQVANAVKKLSKPPDP